jgi:glutamyl/glutaminyl-tRNA synthetase
VPLRAALFPDSTGIVTLSIMRIRSLPPESISEYTRRIFCHLQPFIVYTQHLSRSITSGVENMNEWKLVQKDPSEALAKLHFFSVTKKHASGEIEARITVKEFVTAKTSDMQYFATADIELNQKTLKFQPCGWSETLMGALAECMRNMRKFEYESVDQTSATPSD